MSAMKKTHWLRNTIVVLLICGIAGTALAAVQFKQNPGRTSATASLQFSFDGAAEGLAPNGDTSNVSDLRSDAVLEAGLEAAQLSGVYTADQLRDNLEVTGSYPDNLVQQMTNFISVLDQDASKSLKVTVYHPTLFSVALYNDFDKDIPQEKLEQLLSGILTAYKASFARKYAVSLDWMDDEIYNLDAYDYPQQLTVIREIVTQQARYADEMYEKKPTFRKDRKSFGDISVQFNNLINVDIDRLEALITMNAVSKNTERLITEYQYNMRNLNYQLEEYKQQLQRLDELITSYEKNEIIYLNTADSLTKIDGNSSETYDVLIKNRKAVEDKITDTNTELTKYQSRLAELVSAINPDADAQETPDDAAPADAEDTPGQSDEPVEIQELTEAEIAAVEEAVSEQLEMYDRRVQTLVSKKDAVTEEFKALLQAYMDQEINDQTLRTFNYKYTQQSFLSGAFVKKVIKTAGPLCALGFLLCMALLIASRKKAFKR